VYRKVTHDPATLAATVACPRSPLQAAERGDFALCRELQDLLSRPYDEQSDERSARCLILAPHPPPTHTSGHTYVHHDMCHDVNMYVVLHVCHYCP
jgi:hypothetical protein